MDLTQEQYQLLGRIASENGFVDYQISTIPGSSKGDNYLGIITAITIKSSDKTLDLILKSAQLNEAFRKDAPVTLIYDREIYLYDCIFKEFKKFEEENNISDPFCSIAKTYDFSSEDKNEYLLMENLKTIGYQLWDRKLPMNPQHIKAVLKEYAKFHAVSFAMKDKKPQLFNTISSKLIKNIFDSSVHQSDPENLYKFLDGVMMNAFKAVKDNPDLIECLKKLRIDIADIFENKITDPENQLVIVHGDCWCNNFMFKYEDPSNSVTPSSLRIIDWQISSLSTPAADFCYFFVVHSTKDVLEDYETYAKLYYDTLSSQLRNFKCDPEKIFSYSKFESHLKQFMKWGLYMSFMILKVMLCDSGEAPDFNELLEENKFFSGLSFEIKNFEAYKERLTILIQFMKDYNFL